MQLLKLSGEPYGEKYASQFLTDFKKPALHRFMCDLLIQIAVQSQPLVVDVKETTIVRLGKIDKFILGSCVQCTEKGSRGICTQQIHIQDADLSDNCKQVNVPALQSNSAEEVRQWIDQVHEKATLRWRQETRTSRRLLRRSAPNARRISKETRPKKRSRN